MSNYMELTEEQIQTKFNYMNDYMNSSNAATGSKFDSNANVEKKNIATLENEINKDIFIQLNNYNLMKKITNRFDKTLADKFLDKLSNHFIYLHDASSLKTYCASISMYNSIFEKGLTLLGGESRSPQHLESFCGCFVNLIFAVSSQLAGAVATVEFLMYFDYFARKDYGKNYLTKHRKKIENALQHCVYAINQPAAARGYQSIFWNISIFDKEYFNSMFSEFVFPDFTKPEWNSLNKLQKFFMTWFNKEREKAILTFPVVTAALLTKNGKPKDKPFSRFLSRELSQGNSFFIYMSDNADSLSSCCRLRNEIQDNTFSYSLGAGGVMTGSINVMTLNVNRMVQDAVKKNENIFDRLKQEIEDIQKFQVAYRDIALEYLEKGLLTIYDAGFITLDKQFLTIGLNGLLESAEFLGIEPSNNKEYKEYLQKMLKVIYDCNIEGKQKYKCLFNTEIVPAENLGVKNAKWDKEDGYFVPRECYNSYFYKVEDEKTNVLDKFILHGKEINQFLDGGSALHLNLDEYLTEKQFYQLICISAKTGCNYFTTNVKVTICNECSFINKDTKQHCVKCGSKNVDYATRIIGYLKRISSWSEVRQKEEGLRFYTKEEK